MSNVGELSEAEQKVVSSAANGELCDFGQDDPSQGANWGEERTVRATVIYALCCATREDWPVHAKGVRIQGARIKGQLDFENTTLRYALRLESCFIDAPMRFEQARLRTLTLSGSHTRGLLGEGMITEGLVRLDGGFVSKGMVLFRGATIGGVLSCNGATLENPNGDALNADGVDCKGAMFFRNGFSAKGTVRLPGATIGGNLEFEGATLENPDGNALLADGVDCKGNVFLAYGSSAKGEVRLLNATIGGNLDCSGATLENPNGDALSADGVDCKGDVFLRGGSVRGVVRLLGATIGGNLECHGATLENPDGNALVADGVNCKGDVFLKDGFSAKGTVRLPGATIGGNLEFEGATLENPDGNALVADGVNCKGGVFLRNGFSAKGDVRLLNATIRGNLECVGAILEKPDGVALGADGVDCKGNVFLTDDSSAKGEVRLLNATIGGNLDCSGATLENPNGDALSADGVDCKGDVFLRAGFSAKGTVRLPGATIGGNLDCRSAVFDSPEGFALVLTNTVVKKALRVSGLSTKPRGSIDLSLSQVGSYNDDETSWPVEDTLLLQGFRYRDIEPMDLQMRLRWLGKAPFAMQPYKQFASVLREHGRDAEATRILMDMHRARLESGSLRWYVQAWMGSYGVLMGYGYRPGRVLWLLLGMWFLGFLVFGYARNDGVMMQVGSYHDFNPVVYSLDTLVPVVNLHQEKYWEPRLQGAGIMGGWNSNWIWWYLRLHIALGWVLSTLAVLGFTGVVRRD